MESPNHYELLCVTPDATAAEIRTSYRRLIRIYHPDVAGAAGAAMTLRLNDAQASLLDPTLRARLDSQLRARAGAAQQYAGAGRSGSYSYAAPSYSAPSYSAPSYSAPSYSPAAAPDRPAWLVAFGLSAAIIVAATVTVLAFSYSGTVGLLSPRTIPAYFIAVAWLVGGLSNPPKIFVPVLAFGAALWPLTTLKVGPFAALADAVPSGIWMLLTLVAVAVLVLRLAASRVVPRRRATRHHSPGAH
jgi:hypothetical protein